MAMIASSFVLVLSLISLCIVHALSTGDSTPLGFSAKLIHRDSPESPLYDPSSTPFSRFRAAVHHSVRRANYLRNITVNSRLLKNVEGISGDIITYDNYYMMELHMGNQIVRLMLDTGSSIIFVLCVPCQPCHKHEGTIFDPSASSLSFKNVMCKSHACSLLPHKSCGDSSTKCPMDFAYISGSVQGFYATETIRIDSPDRKVSVEVPRILFGCAHQSNGFSKDIIGIIGLNGYKASLPRQLNSIMGIPNIFSYCLPIDDGDFSEIHFGSAAVISNLKSAMTMAMTIPMFIGDDNYYYIDLKEIIVVGPTAVRPMHVAMKRKKGRHSRRDGNIIIDSGTPLTHISKWAMEHLSKIVKDLVPRPLLEFPEDGTNLMCFNVSHPIEEKLLPIVIIKFSNGVELTVTQPFRYLFADVLCFTLVSSGKDEHEILGSLAHLSYRTVYDLDHGKLTFLPKDC